MRSSRCAGTCVTYTPRQHPCTLSLSLVLLVLLLLSSSSSSLRRSESCCCVRGRYAHHTQQIFCRDCIVQFRDSNGGSNCPTCRAELSAADPFYSLNLLHQEILRRWPPVSEADRQNYGRRTTCLFGYRATLLRSESL